MGIRRRTKRHGMSHKLNHKLKHMTRKQYEFESRNLVYEIIKMAQDKKYTKNPWFQLNKNTCLPYPQTSNRIDDIVSDLDNKLNKIQTAYTLPIPRQVFGYEDPWFECMLNKTTCKACRRSSVKICYIHSYVKGRKIPYIYLNGNPVKNDILI